MSRGGNTDRIWILSNGEIGGGKHLVTGVPVSRIRHAVETSDCPSLPNMQRASLDVRIWPGSADAAVDKALGPPSHKDGICSVRMVTTCLIDC